MSCCRAKPPPLRLPAFQGHNNLPLPYFFFATPEEWAAAELARNPLPATAAANSMQTAAAGAAGANSDTLPGNMQSVQQEPETGQQQLLPIWNGLPAMLQVVRMEPSADGTFMYHVQPAPGVVHV